VDFGDGRDQPLPTAATEAAAHLPEQRLSAPAPDGNGMVEYQTSRLSARTELSLEPEETCVVDAFRCAVGQFECTPGAGMVHLEHRHVDEAGSQMPVSRQLGAAVVKENGRSAWQYRGPINEFFQKNAASLFVLYKAKLVGNLAQLLQQSTGIFIVQLLIGSSELLVQHTITVDCFRKQIHDSCLRGITLCWAVSDEQDTCSALAFFRSQLKMDNPSIKPGGCSLVMVKRSALHCTEYHRSPAT
jgi:hypothetical protein